MGAPDPRRRRRHGREERDRHRERAKVLVVPAAEEDGAAWCEEQRLAGSAIDRLSPGRAGSEGLSPVADADLRTLLRRVFFDLIGLPPSPDEVEAFVKRISDQHARGPGGGR